MRVIADLHGGDENDPVAVAEYEEIKDKVLEDVSHGFGFSISMKALLRSFIYAYALCPFLCSWFMLTLNFFSAPPAKHGHIP